MYTNEYVDTTKEPLFFGKHRNTQRYDENNFDFFANIGLTMQRQFWVPEEVKLLKDKLDFESLTEAENHIFTTQLRKLVMLDSYQGRNPILTFGQLTTNPEFEGALLEQTYFEARLHSRSYSYMIENMYSDPNIIFKESWKDELLLKQAETVSKDGNELYDAVIEYLYWTIHKKEKLPKEKFKALVRKIIIALVSMNILEGIRFYLGFSSVWAITEYTGKLPGSSRMLAFIQRDEKQHLAFTQFSLNTLKKNKHFKDVFKECETEIYDMYFEASEQEFEWADHLYSKGSIMGMNAEIGKDYIKYLTNQRLMAIGLKSIYPEIKKLPIRWVNKYINLHSSEVSLQESEAVDYLTDPIFHDEFDIIKLFDNVLELVDENKEYI